MYHITSLTIKLHARKERQKERKKESCRGKSGKIKVREVWHVEYLYKGFREPWGVDIISRRDLSGEMHIHADEQQNVCVCLLAVSVLNSRGAIVCVNVKSLAVFLARGNGYVQLTDSLIFRLDDWDCLVCDRPGSPANDHSHVAKHFHCPASMCVWVLVHQLERWKRTQRDRSGN